MLVLVKLGQLPTNKAHFISLRHRISNDHPDYEKLSPESIARQEQARHHVTPSVILVDHSTEEQALHHVKPGVALVDHVSMEEGS